MQPKLHELANRNRARAPSFPHQVGKLVVAIERGDNRARDETLQSIRETLQGAITIGAGDEAVAAMQRTLGRMTQLIKGEQ